MVSKKALIELFESELQGGDVKEIYSKGFYYKGLQFYSVQSERAQLIMFEGDCKMALIDIEDIFYLTFNSIKVKITESDFLYLKEILRKKEISDTLAASKKTKERDMKLLNAVFSEKNKKETRKTVIEKTNKKK